jgi:hypothetical protein
MPEEVVHAWEDVKVVDCITITVDGITTTVDDL